MGRLAGGSARPGILRQRGWVDGTCGREPPGVVVGCGNCGQSCVVASFHLANGAPVYSKCLASKSKRMQFRVRSRPVSDLVYGRPLPVFHIIEQP